MLPLLAVQNGSKKSCEVRRNTDGKNENELPLEVNSIKETNRCQMKAQSRDLWEIPSDSLSVSVPTNPLPGPSSSNSSSETSKCLSHHTAATCYCSTCDVNLCTECLLQELREQVHKGHDLVTLRTERNRSEQHDVQRNNSDSALDGSSSNSRAASDHASDLRDKDQNQRDGDQSSMTQPVQHSLYEDERYELTDRRGPQTCATDLDEDLECFYPQNPEENTMKPVENPSNHNPLTNCNNSSDSSAAEDNDFLDELLDLEPQDVVESVRVIGQEADQVFREVEHELSDLASAVYDDIHSDVHEVVTEVRSKISAAMNFWK